MDHAQGMYLMYVDSDDYLCNPDILSIMYRKAEDTDADYMEMASQRVMGRHIRIKRRTISPVQGLIARPELFDTYYISFFGVNILSVTAWGKLYRMETVRNAGLRPSGVFMGEDLAFNIQLFPHLRRIYILDVVGYAYRFGVMTNRYNPHLLPDLKVLYHLKKELIERYGYTRAADFIRIELKNVFRSDICQRIIHRTGSKEEICRQIREELSDSVYQKLGEVTDHPDFLKEPIVGAMLANDAPAVYDIALRQVRNGRATRLIKRWVSGLL
ncbi:hypothetical protein AB9N12_08655 [Bacteroides sp. AN502(2024)]|uniref:hypothetical protein n=1 Tax=Bacteroides sp. AN502(2024) TaxID=3160599 RepID=UPI0035119C92